MAEVNNNGILIRDVETKNIMTMDVVLVAMLGMGVLGAALATIFSQGVSAVLVLSLIHI